MEIHNITGHPIKIGGYGEIPCHGRARLSSTVEDVGDIDGIPVVEAVYGGGVLPSKKEGKIYIVSKLVCEAYPQRDDLYIPVGVNKYTWEAKAIAKNPYFTNNKKKLGEYN